MPTFQSISGESFSFQSMIPLKDVNDLIAIHPPVGNVIELGNFIYYIDSTDFDLGIYRLVTNVDTAIHGWSQQLCLLKTTEDNTDMITANSNFFLFQIALQAEGVNSQALNMTGTTGFESLDMKYVEFRGNTKYGTITGIRQAFWADGFSFNAKEGFTMNGAWAGGFTLRTSRIINTGNYILGEGTGLTMNSIRSDVFATVAGGDVAFDFDFDNFNNDEGYQITDGRFEGAGMQASLFTSAGRDTDNPEKSRRSVFKNNTGNGALNTFEGGSWKVTTETATVVTAVNTPVKLAGTTTYGDLQHFIQTTDNSFVYNSSVAKEFIIEGTVYLSGDAGDVITVILRHWDDSAGVYIDLARDQSEIQNLSGPQDKEKYFPKDVAMLEENDRIEVWAENNTDNGNVTMLIPTQVSITTR